MRKHVVTLEGNAFCLDGPDGATAVQVPGAEAARLADLVLHRRDLEFARQCLGMLGQTSDDTTPSETAWRAAVFTFLKCFDRTGVRVPIEARVIFGGTPPAMHAYDHIRTLRNKHLAHDENRWTECLTVAILNPQNFPKKVFDVRCISFVGDTQGNAQNLANLIEMASKWVDAEFDRVHAILLAELEAEEYETLSAYPIPTYTPPTATEVRQARNRP